jgi:hypothetical protein
MSKGRRHTSVLASIAIMASLLVPLVLASPASATAPQQVSFTLEGCNLGTFDEATVTCDDGDYTTGNLGKDWAELDLVPFRITASAGNSAPSVQTYDVVVAVDSLQDGFLGFDVLSEPVLNEALSDPSCQEAVVGPESTTTGTGGVDEQLYRTMEITQEDRTTCVYDFYARLSLDSSEFPGSDLHANLLNENLNSSGIGEKKVQLPVKDIAPQELDKTMTAVRDADVTWTVEKEATPSELDFEDICDTGSPTSLSTDITITWVKGGAVASDQVLITTVVTATNPANREIRVLVEDEIFGVTPTLTANNGAGVLVPAGTSQTVLTHQETVLFADITGPLTDTATATYVDEVTQVEVPGETTATASAEIQDGDTTNGTISLSDVESITGGGVTFSVDSVVDASTGTDTGGAQALDGDTFTRDALPYTLGSQDDTPITWVSGDTDGIDDSGAVTFTKTVEFDQSGDLDGSLDDTVTLTGSDGFTASDSFSVDLTANSIATLTVNKTTTVPVDGDTTFGFEVFADTGNLDDPNTPEDDRFGATQGTLSITIPDGETGPNSDTLGGLDDGSYWLVETNPGGFSGVAPIPFTVGAEECTVEIDVENGFGPATASALKVTLPDAADAEGWEFSLFLDDGDGIQEPEGDDAPAIATVLTDSTGLADFGQIVDEGDYFIVEVVKDGFVQTSVENCTFTVDYPADAAAVFDDCVITNTKLIPASATVRKVTDPTEFEGGWEFKLYRDNEPLGGTQPGVEDDLLETVSTTNASAVAFTTELEDGNYYILETPQTGWESDGGSAECVFSVDLPADNGEQFDCVFTNTARGTISVAKTLDGSAEPGTATFDFELRTGVDIKEESDPLDDDPGIVVDNGTATIAADGVAVQIGGDLVPGTYNLCEIVMPGFTATFDGNAGYTLVDNLSNERLCYDVTVTVENQDVTVNVDNQSPPGGEARTIGFWKNWTSCDGSGNQDPVLDQTVDFANGGFVRLGNPAPAAGATIDSCIEAVRILNKQPMDGSVKKAASDPAYNLASQLLAAKLNVLAGAAHGCIDSVITQADNLLSQIGFDGTSKFKANMTAGQKNLANSLALLLDQYNNFGCP